MRILLVNAYPRSSHKGQERFAIFKGHVLWVLRELERKEVFDIHVLERHRNELDEFLFELHSEFTDPRRINDFDQLDFVFLDGDLNGTPWSTNMRQVALLTKMCMMTGKCLFATNIGAALVAFLCSTGGEQLVVKNNQSQGEPIDNIQQLPPPVWASPSPRKHPTRPKDDRDDRDDADSRRIVSVRANEVVLDTKTGDFFWYDDCNQTWVPRGNTGLILHSSNHSRDYGARINSARAGTKSHRVDLRQELYASKRGDIRCCCRLEWMNKHAIFKNFPRREMLVNCKSKWDLDEEISSTGNNKYSVLVDSARGPMLIEFGNAVGSHFPLGLEYPDTLRLLENYVSCKWDQIKTFAHVDRSYVTAISGPATIPEQQLQQATSKAPSCVHYKPAYAQAHGNTINSSSDMLQPQPAMKPRAASAPAHRTSIYLSSCSRHTSTKSNNNEQDNHGAWHTMSTATIVSGKSSPKKCRPVSAGPLVYPRTSCANRSQSTAASSTSTANEPAEFFSTEDYTTKATNPLCGSSPTLRTSHGDTSTHSHAHARMIRARSSCTSIPENQSKENEDGDEDVEQRQEVMTEQPDLGLEEHHKARPPQVSPPANQEKEAAVFLSPPSSLTHLTSHKSPTTTATVPVKIQRVIQKGSLRKPFCAMDKFNKLSAQEAAESHRRHHSKPKQTGGQTKHQHPGDTLSAFFSIRNDAPYQSVGDLETLERQKNKLKWIGGPFDATVGKATTTLKPQASIFANEVFIEANTPFNIIQRR